jgi:hypothetical protein
MTQSLPVISGAASRLLFLVEASKASFTELAGGDALPSVGFQIASDIARGSSPATICSFSLRSYRRGHYDG